MTEESRLRSAIAEESVVDPADQLALVERLKRVRLDDAGEGETGHPLPDALATPHVSPASGD